VRLPRIGNHADRCDGEGLRAEDDRNTDFYAVRIVRGDEMGVRPPAGDDDEEPDVVTFGIAAVDGRLAEADVEFPATTAELERQLGDAEIPYDASGRTIRISSALERTAVEEFETRQDLLNVLHPVFEERRESTSSGLLGQLRAMLPF
jgi:hypothetical protein